MYPKFQAKVGLSPILRMWDVLPGTFAVFAQCAAICVGSVMAHWWLGQKSQRMSAVCKAWMAFICSNDSSCWILQSKCVCFLSLFRCIFGTCGAFSRFDSSFHHRKLIGPCPTDVPAFVGGSPEAPGCSRCEERKKIREFLDRDLPSLVVFGYPESPLRSHVLRPSPVVLGDPESPLRSHVLRPTGGFGRPRITSKKPCITTPLGKQCMGSNRIFFRGWTWACTRPSALRDGASSLGVAEGDDEGDEESRPNRLLALKPQRGPGDGSDFFGWISWL